jgi:hypothetical protein
MAIHTNPPNFIAKAFLPPSVPCNQTAFTPRMRGGARCAGLPSTQRFSDAGSHGKSANIIILLGAGRHQPNLTGRVPFARYVLSASAPV